MTLYGFAGGCERRPHWRVFRAKKTFKERRTVACSSRPSMKRRATCWDLLQEKFLR